MSSAWLLRRARAALLWLLAGVVPLQCGAALVRASAGPSHVHAVPASAPTPVPVLHDFRRHPPAAVLLAGLRAVDGRGAPSRHGHAHAEQRRHHHGADEGVAAVVIDGDVDRRDAADESSPGGGGSVPLPIPAVTAAWLATAATHGRIESALWVASHRVDPPAERPPRHDEV